MARSEQSQPASPGQPMPTGGRVVIMGAAGRDFHNFNLLFRDNPAFRVVAFTAAQIPEIDGRRYPPSLAGPLYPDGIPIHAEAALPELIQDERIDWVYFSYSDLSHLEVMHRASVVLAAGASFALAGPRATMLRASRPVISVGAVRTGAGKSPLSRYLVRWLRQRGRRVVVLRHPMPYGDLACQAIQRFASFADLDRADPTIEEREEYEPYLEAGVVVFAGVDYARILAAAEAEAEVLLWDGGNNDFPFLRSDLHLVLLDAHRPGHELAYHPGEANLRLADVLIVSKVDSAPPGYLEQVLANARAVRPDTPLLLADLEPRVERPERLAGRRVVLVGDGPSLTHGGLTGGAASLVAQRAGVAEIVDPRPYLVGTLAAAAREFPHLGLELPALGYGHQQIADLEATLRRVPADLVLDGSPVRLARLLDPGKPLIEVGYEFQERGRQLEAILEHFAERFPPLPQ